MQFPDAVTILRQAGSDEYGNPGKSWDNPTQAETRGFHLQRPGAPDLLLMPPRTDIRPTDRVRVQGRLFKVDGDPVFVRSPSKDVMTQVGLVRLEVK